MAGRSVANTAALAVNNGGHSSLSNKNSSCSSGGGSSKFRYKNNTASAHTQYSANWSGAIVHGTGYETVTGTIVVPQPQIPDGGDLDQFYGASAWVGLDGDSDCPGAILQVGIDFNIQNGIVGYEAWFEWYPDYAYNFVGFPIHAGDVVTLTATAANTTVGSVMIENKTTAQSVMHTFVGETQPLCRTSAEWIVEDYSVGGELVEMCDWGWATFTDCAAEQSSGLTASLSNATMYDIFGNGNMNQPGGRDVGRAERFEDEKRRVIESCFSKRDEDGSIIETYITHIRIHEYSSHPTSPPPPQSRTPQSEKNRVIIVAVRKSGRVRVHKSKENPNGTFSIGKTWDLNDLLAIESYTAPNVSPDFRQWAGNVGFLITLGKPYYWQAQTDKEKRFFIASLLKIYGKYSGGKVPLLAGFDAHELEQIQGGAQRRAPPPAQLQTTRSHSQSQQSQQSLQSQQQQVPIQQVSPPPLSAREPVPSSATTASTGAADFHSQRTAILSNGIASPATSIDLSSAAKQATLQRIAGSNKSQESVAASQATRSDDGSYSLPPRSRNGFINGATSLAGSAAGSAAEGAAPLSLAESPAITKGNKPPPERKRPPMDPSRPQGLTDDGLVPAPLMSSTRSRDGSVVPPPRSSNRSSPFHDSSGQTNEAATPSVRSPINGSLPYSIATKSTPPAQISSTSLQSSDSSAEGSAAVGAAVPAVAAASTREASTRTTIEPPPIPADPEDDRPGLGPMIKKRSKGDIANAFWKAATAANAFKPRQGGAGERLRQAQNKAADGPDGITGVVPAPPRPISAEKPKTPATASEPQPLPKTPQRSSMRSIPEVKITVPNSSRPSSTQAAAAKEATAMSAADTGKAKPAIESVPRKAAIVGNDAKYLATLGVDSAIMDKRGAEFASWLDYFGWVPGTHMRSVNMDDLKVDVDRELNRVQAGGWFSRFQEEDERVETVKKGIDMAIDECEELDNLLTLYSVELSTLSDDIAYIEAQGQGLQVQAANQKLLRKELESLLDTCAITATDLEVLRTAPLETTSGVEAVEAALVLLFNVMSKIDPSMSSGGAADAAVLAQLADAAGENLGSLNADFGQMRIVREKKEIYKAENDAFMRRLVIFMASQFDEAFTQTRKAMEGALSKKVDPRNHDVGRDLLWKYSPLVLYAREVDLPNWNRLLQIYEEKSSPLYKSEFRDLLMAWKKNAHKHTGDDSEILFTALQEKKEEGIATTARKLTVKRSQTLARSLRSPLGDGGGASGIGANSSRSHLDKTSSDSRRHAYEVFASVLDELLPVVQMEQNFVIDMFHATTLQQADFTEVVAACRPAERRGCMDLRRLRTMEPDRELARRVTRAMEVIFSFLEQDLQNLIDWVLAAEALQGIGVMATLERKMAEVGASNQEFMHTVLQRLHGALEGRFGKFVDEQIRAIEETKVKIKKRKGVIGFMRIFPNFSAAVENMLADIEPSLPICRNVDGAYNRILRSMFDSLKVIARENPTMGVAAAGSADPEDKEALNFHILLIENMNHYLEDVDNSRGLQVLDDWKAAAAAELAEHMGLYLNAVMRRPLGRLLEHLENVESQLAAGRTPATVAAQPSNSKAMFNKVLGSYDAKEVRKGIETLRKRVEKHFSGADDEQGSSGLSLPLSSSSGKHTNQLVNYVVRECEAFYNDVETRIGNITTNVYGGDVLYEWPRAEVKLAFATLGAR
ncbi:hypothetical protein SEPCBS119000_000791 [Sporothrix epigloea]|uniref:Exocyst complex component Sec3 PIP2-binding N-terminal domain-containing protein n=1 Tax=Sporothrix epigloea TaxID=1892477 RepID=A0ABP0D872_9PEZI